MLRPRTGPHRLTHDLSGFWCLRPDPDDRGEAAGWAEGFDGGHAFAIPGSWNEQLAEVEDADLGTGLADYVGACWVARDVFVPEAMDGQRIFLRVGSADYRCTAFVNGARAGESTAAFLPFDAEITDRVTPGRTVSVMLRVDNRATGDTIPQGIASHEFAEPKERGARAEHYPPARYDFFPYGGVHRGVTLYSLPRTFIEDVRVETTLDGTVRVEVDVNGEVEGLRVEAHLGGENATAEWVREEVEERRATVTLKLDQPRLWSPEDPYLYDLALRLVRLSDGKPLDRYRLPVGIREVRVEGSDLLLNGEKVFLRGFGKHEDFPVLGKAHSPALVVKDFELLRWTGANSFRTSHYPYSEDWLDEADRRGVLVLSEVPAVSLNHAKATDATQAAHAEAIRQLVRRDRNHPSVIGWVIGNEPGLSGEEEATTEVAADYWQPLFDLTRALDASRPVTVPTHNRGPGVPLYPLCDFISINRYYGWYAQPGQLDRAAQLLQDELDEIEAEHGKPILVSEFGADTLAGAHATVPRQFTEEYQASFIETYLDVIEAHPACCGAHVWNFADFRTPQNFRRVVDNLKGVFTRTREPKRAAFALRSRWTGRRGPGMTPLADPTDDR